MHGAQLTDRRRPVSLMVLSWPFLFLLSYEDRNTVGREANRNVASSASRALPGIPGPCFLEEGGAARSPVPGHGAGIAGRALKMLPGSGGNARSPHPMVPRPVCGAGIHFLPIGILSRAFEALMNSVQIGRASCRERV